MAAVGVAVAQARNDLRDDDWAYLAWGRGEGALRFLTDPPPYPYFRPLNALSWQALTRLAGTDPWPSELLLLGLWAVALVLVYAIAARALGPLGGALAVLLAICTREFRELVNWRSWLTTTGGLVGILGAVWLADRGRGRLALAALAFGAGFKEVAWWHGAGALAARGRPLLAAVAVGALAIQAGLLAHHPPGEVSLAFVPGNLAQAAETFWRWTWPPALVALALAAPREAWRDGALLHVAAAVAALVPPLCFYRFSPFYLLEAAMLLLLALLPVAVRGARSRRGLALAVTALSVWTLTRPPAWADFAENVPWQQRRMREGRALAERGRGATAVWAPAGDVGPCGLAADLLAWHGAGRLAERPTDGRELRDCLVVR